MSKRVKLYYADGFVSGWMNDTQIERWFKMNNENSNNIMAIHTEELMDKKQAEEYLKKLKEDLS